MRSFGSPAGESPKQLHAELVRPQVSVAERPVRRVPKQAAAKHKSSPLLGNDPALEVEFEEFEGSLRRGDRSFLVFGGGGGLTQHHLASSSTGIP
jgi:hypothetical protein